MDFAYCTDLIKQCEAAQGRRPPVHLWSTEMRLTTTLAAAAALAVTGFAANAGGLAPEVVEPEVVVVDEPAPAGSSVNSTFIIVGIIAALLIAAAVEAD